MMFDDEFMIFLDGLIHKNPSYVIMLLESPIFSTIFCGEMLMFHHV